MKGGGEASKMATLACTGLDARMMRRAYGYNKTGVREPPEIYSGPATLRDSTSPVEGSRISSQLTASSASPVEVETANSTPSEFAAVERKSAR